MPVGALGGGESTLRARFLDLLEAWDVQEGVAEAFGVLVRCYGEPHRHYHHLGHIEDCLAKFDGLRGQVVWPREVELAIWYHDLVYDPRSSTNEEDSAVLMHRVMEQLGVGEESIRMAEDLILTTKHSGPLPSGDAWILHDVDLSILGADESEYDNYCWSIRSEYAMFPDESYRQGRASFLNRMLEMDRIFLTDPFRDRFELRARKNLERERTALER